MRTNNRLTWLWGLVWTLACICCRSVEAQAPATSAAAVAGVQSPADEAASQASAAPPPSAPAKRSDAELEKLAAPIAIYPDPLIASILPAAVYPLEIVQAARFVANTNNLVRLDMQPWDANVKAVAKFPVIIQKMNQDLDWTIRLGQAFLEQPMDLMNAIQALRVKAQAAGNLKTTEQQVVTSTNAVVERMYEGEVIYVTNTVVQVQPASKEVVYVPTYNPSTIYIDDDDDDEAVIGLVSFGVGVAFGAAIWGDCDWHYGGCYWGHYPPPPPPMPPPYHPPPGGTPPPPGGRPPGSVPPGTRPPGSQPPGNRPPGAQPPGGGRPPGSTPPTASTRQTQRWQPDQTRMSTSGAGAPAARTMEARGWGTGGTRPSTQPVATGRSSIATGAAGARPSTGAVATRPATGAVGARPAPSTGLTRPTQAPAGGYSRPAASQPMQRPTATPASRGSAFSGVNSGSSARNYSSRGTASRAGGGGARGGGGGFRGGGGRR